VPDAAATVLALFVGPADQTRSDAVPRLDLDFGGVVGDRHHGLTTLTTVRERPLHVPGTEVRNLRQLTVVDTAELAATAAAMGIEAIDPGWVGANICTEGLPELTFLPGMARLVFAGGAVLVNAGQNMPCTGAGAEIGVHAGTVPSAFPKAAISRRGIIAWVEHPAPIEVGESVHVVLPRAVRPLPKVR